MALLRELTKSCLKDRLSRVTIVKGSIVVFFPPFFLVFRYSNVTVIFSRNWREKGKI